MKTSKLNIICRICCVLFLAAILSFSTSSGVGAETGYGAFAEAHGNFHTLIKDKDKSWRRDEWKKLEKQFLEVYDKYSDTDFGPKSLYYLGRVYEELALRSARKDDFESATEWYARCYTRFPKHNWSDDCLYRLALIRIEHLNMPTKAKSNLQAILNEYPKGDMRDEARALLAKIDNDGAVAEAPKPKANPVSKPKEKVAPKPAPKPVAKAKSASKPEPPPEPTPEPTPEPVPEPAPKVEPAPADGSARLEMIRYTSSSDYTRVVLELNRDVKYVYKFLDPAPDKGLPHRVYVDVYDTAIGSGIKRNETIANGMLRGYRASQNEPGVTRVVLDLMDMQEHKVFHLSNPFRVVIDVYAPEEGATAAAPVAAAKKTPAKPYRPPQGSKKMAGDLVEQLGLGIKTIMIDPGHGGNDKGAIYFGIKEKDVNLRMAKILGKMLKEKGFNVLYTRTDDSFVALEKRTAMANAKKADIFISLHANAHQIAKINGLETYTLNLARTKDAVRIAARENAVSPKQISDLQVILTELALNSKVSESTDLAESIQKKAVEQVSKKWKLRDHGHREAPFYVLLGAKMPAVLVEMGYLSNKTEAKRLNSEEYLTHMARGLVNGVLSYKKKIQRFAEG